jgi:hypothetical protein
MIPTNRWSEDDVRGETGRFGNKKFCHMNLELAVCSEIFKSLRGQCAEASERGIYDLQLEEEFIRAKDCFNRLVKFWWGEGSGLRRGGRNVRGDGEGNPSFGQEGIAQSKIHDGCGLNPVLREGREFEIFPRIDEEGVLLGFIGGWKASHYVPTRSPGPIDVVSHVNLFIHGTRYTSSFNLAAYDLQFFRDVATETLGRVPGGNNKRGGVTRCKVFIRDG